MAVPMAVLVVAVTNPLADARADSTVKTCTTLAEDGQRLRAAGRLIEARENLIGCSSTECPQVVRTDCAQWASEVLAATPTIIVDPKDKNGTDIAHARVFIDGKRVADKIDGRPISIDPGSHTIRVERYDGAAAQMTLVAKENVKGREVPILFSDTSSGSASEPDTSLPKPATGGGWTWPHYAGLGMIVVGGIAIAYSTVNFVLYRSEESSLRSKFADADAAARTCPPDAPVATTCGKNIATREDLRAQYNANEADAKERAPIVLAGWIGGTLLIGGGILLMVLAPSSSPSTTKVRGAPMIGPRFAGLSLSGSF